MFAYDKTFDPEVVLGHCDLITRFSDFALYLDTQLVYFHTFYTPPLKKVRGIMLYPPKKNLRSSVRPSVCLSVCPSVCLSVCLSVCPSISVSFPGSILSIHRPIFFKLCIGVHIRKEWFGIEDG